MRTNIIAGNWKLNGTLAEAEALIKELIPLVAASKSTAEVVVCPPFTALAKVGELVAGSKVALGSQDVFWKTKGAYTGQIAPRMLVELGVKYAIIGHSERRGRFGVPEPDFTPEVLALFGDNDVTVNLKLKAAQEAGLIAIVCVGETLQERKDGKADSIIAGQVEGALKGVSADDTAKLVFAYEPVWAIGTGETCAADEADRICGVIRATVGKVAGAPAAEAVRVQYGGSVKASNAKDLLSRPNIDGALVGGAALKAADFIGIIDNA